MAIVQIALQPALLLFVFSFLMSDFFDTMGTVVAVAEQGDFADKDGNVKDIQPILTVDSAAAAAGGFWSKLHHGVRGVDGGSGCGRAHGPVQYRGGDSFRRMRVSRPGDRHGLCVCNMRRACRGWLSHAFGGGQCRLVEDRVRISRIRHDSRHSYDLLDHERHRVRIHLVLRGSRSSREKLARCVPSCGLRLRRFWSCSFSDSARLVDRQACFSARIVAREGGRP